jgi:hypothetical protein
VLQPVLEPKSIVAEDFRCKKKWLDRGVE